MKYSRQIITLLAIVSAVTFTACDDDSDEVTPVEMGAQVVVTNTFQSEAFQVPDETLFDIVGDSTTITVVDGVDLTIFSYEVDITETSITFSVPEDAESDFFRVIEAGTYDRYYFTFSPSQNITAATTTTTGVTAYPITSSDIATDAEFVIEIGEGFDLKAGIEFTVELEN